MKEIKTMFIGGKSHLKEKWVDVDCHCVSINNYDVNLNLINSENYARNVMVFNAKTSNGLRSVFRDVFALETVTSQAEAEEAWHILFADRKENNPDCQPLCNPGEEQQ